MRLTSALRLSWHAPLMHTPAAAATVPHLGAKLASAFGAALGTSLDGRKQMIRQALDKRFSLDVQMDAYQQLWNRVRHMPRASAHAHTESKLCRPLRLLCACNMPKLTPRCHIA